MRSMKTAVGSAITAGLIALSLAACSSGDPGAAANSAASGGTASEPAAAPSFEVKAPTDLTGSPTYDRIQKAGKVVVGVKEDQPNLGYLDPITSTRSGFDVEVAQWMAASLGIPADKIEYKKIASANREQALINGDVDYYVGTYSITDKRKEQVGFAGPYFETGQGLLVKKGNTAIKSDADLAGKNVCSATGSTPLQNIQENYKDTKVTPFDTYSQCVEALNNGSVDAVTTDEAILIGYAAQDPDNLEVVGKPFTTEKYGIGVAKDDAALRHYFNKVLTDGSSTWTQIYDNTLGKSGTKVEQPKVDDYA